MSINPLQSSLCGGARQGSFCAGARKRSEKVRGSPITDSEGNVFLFQILWSGQMFFCHPKIGEHLKRFISDVVVHDRAKDKTQTDETTYHLIEKIHMGAKEVKRLDAFPGSSPVMMVIDNVSGHSDDADKLEKVEDNSYHCKDGIYAHTRIPFSRNTQLAAHSPFRGPTVGCNVALTLAAAF